MEMNVNSTYKPRNYNSCSLHCMRRWKESIIENRKKNVVSFSWRNSRSTSTHSSDENPTLLKSETMIVVCHCKSTSFPSYKTVCGAVVGASGRDVESHILLSFYRRLVCSLVTIKCHVIVHFIQSFAHCRTLEHIFSALSIVRDWVLCEICSICSTPPSALDSFIFNARFLIKIVRNNGGTENESEAWAEISHIIYETTLNSLHI